MSGIAMLAKDTRGDLGVVPHGWVLEPKLDGWRYLVAIANGCVVSGHGRSGKGHPIPGWMQTWADTLAPGTILDGELVCVDQSEKSPVVAHRLARGGDGLRYVAFDMLALAGLGMKHLPWHERRAHLETVVDRLDSDYVTVPPTQVYTGSSSWHDALVAQGFEGTVAKDPNGLYEPGARRWLKIKPQETMDAIVTGWKYGAGKSNGHLVGALHITLENGVQTTCAWKGTPQQATSLTGQRIEIRHHGVFASGSVRHPIFARVREDL